MEDPPGQRLPDSSNVPTVQVYDVRLPAFKDQCSDESSLMDEDRRTSSHQFLTTSNNSNSDVVSTMGSFSSVVSQQRQRYADGEPAIVIAEQVQRLSLQQQAADASSPLVLFVDDNPENNVEEAAYLKELGYDVISTNSTASAMTLLKQKIRIDIVVSDMARREEEGTTTTRFAYRETAGLDLLRSMRQIGLYHVPMIFYSTCSPEKTAVAKQLGAFAVVVNKQKLFKAIEDALPYARVTE